MLAVLNVFSRFPRRGRVKTRLAVAVGTHRALALHRWMTARTIAVARRVPQARTVLWTAGPRWHPAFDLVAPADRRVQPPGDLGARMGAAIRWSLVRAPAAVVIGSDCPTLEADHLAAALEALADHDVVFGPALDGGYYLIAVRRPVPGLLRGIAWGGARVLAQSLRRARRAGLAVALLAPLADVDTAADLAAAPVPRWPAQR